MQCIVYWGLGAPTSRFGGTPNNLAPALVDSNYSSHCFAQILDDFLRLASSIRNHLAQVAFDLIDRCHVSSVKILHQ